MRAAKIAVALAVMTMLLVAHRVGVFEQVGDPGRLRQTLVELGPWGYFAFVVAFALIQPFGVPGTVFLVAAPLIWPWPVAFGLSMVGTVSASVVGSSFARFVARDSVSAAIPARFRRYDEALARRAFTTVFLLRLVFWMHPLLHAFFGVSKVRFWTHFWGSAAGYVLPVFLVSFFGTALVEALKDLPAGAWGAAAAAVAVIATGAWLLRRRAERPARCPHR